LDKKHGELLGKRASKANIMQAVKEHWEAARRTDSEGKADPISVYRSLDERLEARGR